MNKLIITFLIGFTTIAITYFFNQIFQNISDTTSFAGILGTIALLLFYGTLVGITVVTIVKKANL
ncbi:hypothetical protein [Bacillus sp. AG4(2022)]|uniref:hypothetical protein n=1 Tax=Bacillus sp. AG4(2022) TaxID=2962594 RepID=UPI002882CA11|nr:hypothetical protein [Bacillus sp. AG4(2022)]MDT0160416.1 hypothetical protein [Bacillus sp. AG4(2022)]